MEKLEQKLGTGTVNELAIASVDGSRVQDLRNTYTELSYYESILNTSVSLQVVIADGSGIKNYLPIVGGERLAYNFTDPFNSVDVDIANPLRVYKISDRKKESNDIELYRLLCTTNDMIKTRYEQVDRSMSNMKYSDMIEKILREYMNADLFGKDETEGLHKHVFSRMTPFAAIKQIAEESQCSSNDRGSSSYFFWQNNDGYQFRHLESLLSEPPLRKYYFFFDEIPSDFQYEGARILTMRELVSFDLLGGVNDGEYGINVKYYDPISKTLFNSKYSYFDSFSQTKHNGFPLLSSSVSEELSQKYSLEKYITTNRVSSTIPYVSDRDSNLRTQFRRRQNFIGASTSINSRIRNSGIQAVVYGDSRISAGLTIDIEIPTTGQKRSISSDLVDRFSSGKYLVTAVRHEVTPTTYYTVMTLSKESYLKKPEIGDEI